VGYAIHHVVSLGWAVLHEKHVAALIERQSAPTRFLAGAATAAFACFVDFQVARGRAQPGFEKQLTRGSLLLVYAAFALGLALCPQASIKARTRQQAGGGAASVTSS
jgi:hypothetical protein